MAHPTGAGPLTWKLREVEGKHCAWLDGSIELHVKGEFYRQEHLAQIRGLVGVQMQHAAWLVLEPGNKHDANAVRVDVYGGAAGYIPREEAPRWQPVLLAIERATGRKVACGCRLFTSQDRSGNECVEVVLKLPPLPSSPDLIAPGEDPAPVAKPASYKPDSPVIVYALIALAGCIGAAIIGGAIWFGLAERERKQQDAAAAASSRPSLGDRFRPLPSAPRASPRR